QGVVRHDGDCADADLAQRLGLLHDAADGRPYIGTVVADEDDERALRPAHVGERIGPAVHACEREVLRLPAKVANGGFRQCHRASSTTELQCCPRSRLLTRWRRTASGQAASALYVISLSQTS